MASFFLLWLRQMEPLSFERATAILGYPQYWSWRLGGRQVAETTYMGCHSHIWAPARGDYSSLVDEQGWRDKLPPFARAGAIIGTSKWAGDKSPFTTVSTIAMPPCKHIARSGLSPSR